MRSYQLSAISRQFIITLVFITLIGCSDSPQDPATLSVSADPPATQKMVRPLPEAVLPDGNRLTLELALTQDEISQGLMFRNSLPNDRGMLFIFREERVPSFWMKNTLIPLDMVFLSADGVIVDVIHNALPCKTDPCPQYVPRTQALAVLEVAAGVAESQSLDEGVSLKFERVPGYPREPAP